MSIGRFLLASWPLPHSPTGTPLISKRYQLSGAASPYGLQHTLCTLHLSCSPVRQNCSLRSHRSARGATLGSGGWLRVLHRWVISWSSLFRRYSSSVRFSLITSALDEVPELPSRDASRRWFCLIKFSSTNIHQNHTETFPQYPAPREGSRPEPTFSPFREPNTPPNREKTISCAISGGLAMVR